MRKLSDIIKEANEIQTYLAKCTIDMEVVTSSTDITNAGEEVTSLLDEIERILNNYGFKVNATHMTEIDLLEVNENKINESIEQTEEDINEPNASILNDTHDQVLTAQVIDIFDVVEKRISKVKDENVRNRMIEMLINKISNINENNEFMEEISHNNIVYHLSNGDDVRIRYVIDNVDPEFDDITMDEYYEVYVNDDYLGNHFEYLDLYELTEDDIEEILDDIEY